MGHSKHVQRAKQSHQALPGVPKAVRSFYVPRTIKFTHKVLNSSGQASFQVIDGNIVGRVQNGTLVLYGAGNARIDHSPDVQFRQ